MSTFIVISFFVLILTFLIRKLIRLMYWSIRIHGINQTVSSMNNLISLYLYLDTVNTRLPSDIAEVSIDLYKCGLALNCHYDGDSPQASFSLRSDKPITKEAWNELICISTLIQSNAQWTWYRPDAPVDEIMYYNNADQFKYDLIPVVLAYNRLLNHIHGLTINSESGNEYIHRRGVDHCFSNYIHSDPMDGSDHRHQQSR